MTIDEAIKELSKLGEIVFIAKSPDRSKAVKLGIEALRRIQRQRKDLMPSEIRLLPGETET